jgi:hypothetical protein
MDIIGSGRDPPDLLELNMSEESESAAAAPRHLDSPSQDDNQDHEDIEEEYMENGMEIKQESTDQVPGTSQGKKKLPSKNKCSY